MVAEERLVPTIRRLLYDLGLHQARAAKSINQHYDARPRTKNIQILQRVRQEKYAHEVRSNHSRRVQMEKFRHC